MAGPVPVLMLTFNDCHDRCTRRDPRNRES